MNAVAEHTLKQLAARAEQWRESGKRVFATTSLQSQSLPLLHLLKRVDPELPSYYIDTGYLFPETLRFRDRLIEEFGFNIHALSSTATTEEQWGADGRPLFESDPDACCTLNKVNPMVPVLRSHQVWVNGVRADQSHARSVLDESVDAGYGCVRYHPLLAWTRADVEAYRKEFGLPVHPLALRGYRSIGCWPCTRPTTADAEEREGRWAGTHKVECGLHTALVVHTEEKLAELAHSGLGERRRPLRAEELTTWPPGLNRMLVKHRG
jgi:phosphoadenosine phosphosulfate reductase